MAGRIATYLTKFKNLVSTDPVLFSDQNTEVNQIYQNMNDLDAGVAKIGGESTQDFIAKILSVYNKALFDTGGQINTAGMISGNLIFNTTALPPKISSGIREVKSKNIQEIADVALALTDAFGVCSQALTDYTYCWVKILVDNSGNYKFIPSFDPNTVGSLTDIAVSSIGVTGGNATVLTADTTGLAAGHMVIIKGSDVGYLIGKVVSVSAGVNFVIKTSAGNGTYSAGTYSVYYRVDTTNTDADIITFKPSPTFNPVLQGYYRGVDGDIDTSASGEWRDIGAFYIDVSGNVDSDYVVSYKSRDDLGITIGILSLTLGSIPRATIASGYSAIPNDDSTPQITEGAEIGTITVTPRSATSTLKFTINCSIFESANVADGIVLSLFKAGTSDALQTVILNTDDWFGLNGQWVSAIIVVPSHGTSAKIYSIRAGCMQGHTQGLFINKDAVGGATRFNLTTSPFICEEIES